MSAFIARDNCQALSDGVLEDGESHYHSPLKERRIGDSMDSLGRGKVKDVDLGCQLRLIRNEVDIRLLSSRY